MNMQKIEAASPEAQSANLVADNVAQLKALFPELVTEGPNGPAVNVDVLKALVGDTSITDADERFGLNWQGNLHKRTEDSALMIPLLTAAYSKDMAEITWTASLTDEFEAHRQGR